MRLPTAVAAAACLWFGLQCLQCLRASATPAPDLDTRTAETRARTGLSAGTRGCGGRSTCASASVAWNYTITGPSPGLGFSRAVEANGLVYVGLSASASVSGLVVLNAATGQREWGFNTAGTVRCTCRIRAFAVFAFQPHIPVSVCVCV